MCRSVGFDDFQAVSNVVEPELTTMSPYHEMGSLAVETLVGMLKGTPPKVLGTKYRCKLIERASVCQQNHPAEDTDLPARLTIEP